MKPPKKCNCYVHATADYTKHSRDAVLIRRVRRAGLEQARKCRIRAQSESDQKEKNYLETVAICAEWEAWVCLVHLRDIKANRAYEKS
jgi:hypothetical protein